MKPTHWPCPAPDGSAASEYALVFDRNREKRLLVIPALFDEANRLRRLTVEVMRRLDASGIDCFLPDLPGCNESLQDLSAQSLSSWTDAVLAAGIHFRANAVLAIRGGCLLAPPELPGWLHAPVKGATILRQMLRMRVLAAREAGRDETADGLLELGAKGSVELAGYPLSSPMIAELQSAAAPEGTHSVVGQDMIGGAPLWLRAEPGENRNQADALAAIVAVGLAQ